jgi:hypothetical protein
MIFGALCWAIERCAGVVRIDMIFSYGLLFLVAVTRPCASATRSFCAEPRIFSVKCFTLDRKRNLTKILQFSRGRLTYPAAARVMEKNNEVSMTSSGR